MAAVITAAAALAADQMAVAAGAVVVVILAAAGRQAAGKASLYSMKLKSIVRFFKHLISNVWQVRHHFSESALHNIEKAIRSSEKSHNGEICFIVEAGLHPMEIRYKKSPRKRAIELFSLFKIWDTEHNNGVLIYLLLADRDVEIVADRGIHQHVGNAAWERICHQMELMFRSGDFEAGVLQGIADIGALLETHFPHSASNDTKKVNELPNAPIIL